MLFRSKKQAREQAAPARDQATAAAPAAPSNSPRDKDPLASSLVFLASYHGRAVSREALLGGLPIVDGHLSVALYERAARRAGLQTEAVRRDLTEIP
ncbi:MAG: type I secretion system permease/ATPase, partial [Bradyrhizobium icense]